MGHRCRDRWGRAARGALSSAGVAGADARAANLRPVYSLATAALPLSAPRGSSYYACMHLSTFSTWAKAQPATAGLNPPSATPWDHGPVPASYANIALNSS